MLKRALESLVRQTLDKTLYEIIVVDNNSSDNTRLEVERFSNVDAVRYVFEKQQGLSYARNRGWQEARGEYIAYIDDDCTVPSQWLAVANEIIDKLTPGMFGGPYLASYDAPKPKWFKDSYGSHVQGNKARFLAKHEYLDGGNMFIRQSLLEKAGGFDVAWGMSGNKLGYAEETVLQNLIRSTMPEERIYYDPSLEVYHLVHSDKMSLRWRFIHCFIDGRYSSRVWPQYHISPIWIISRTMQQLAALVSDLTLKMVFRDRKRYPFPQNFLFEEAFRHVQALGTLYEQLTSVFQKPTSSSRLRGVN